MISQYASTEQASTQVLFHAYMPSSCGTKTYLVGLFRNGQSICSCLSNLYGKLREGPNFHCKHCVAAKIIKGC